MTGCGPSASPSKTFNQVRREESRLIAEWRSVGVCGPQGQKGQIQVLCVWLGCGVGVPDF